MRIITSFLFLFILTHHSVGQQIPRGYLSFATINIDDCNSSGSFSDILISNDDKYLLIGNRTNPFRISIFDAKTLELVKNIELNGWSDYKGEYDYNILYCNHKFHFIIQPTFGIKQLDFYEFNVETLELKETDVPFTPSDCVDIVRNGYQDLYKLDEMLYDQWLLSETGDYALILKKHGVKSKSIQFVLAQKDKASYNLPDSNPSDNGSVILPKGDYYSIIIGVNNYDNYDQLTFPISDAENMQNVLIENYSFDLDKSVLLTNPTRNDIFTAFNSLRERVKTKDNLLVFYAGHGEWDEETNDGYWLPSNAMIDNRSEWISVRDLATLINQIDCTNVLVVADACFAGSLFKTRSINNNLSRAIEELYLTPSRKAITSGAMEEVPDKSVFCKYLLKEMTGNNKRYLSAFELFHQFQQTVINNSSNSQIPQYGTLTETGDEGGDFVFIKRE